MSADFVKQIQVEADFYNLPTLVEECEQYLVNRIGDYLEHDDDVQCKYYSRNKDDLVNVLGSVWAPFCIKGVDHFRRDITVHKSSTLLALNIDELCAAAAQAPFGKGTESLVDPSVRDALEIEYFEFEGRCMGPAEENLERVVSSDTSAKIYTALDNELDRFDDVVICLTHLYPLCQADPACLKGGDALLYELLAQREKEYELSI
eukprot:gene26618-30079_t